MRSRNFLAFLLALFVVSVQLIGCGGGESAVTISGSLPATGTVGTAYSGSLTAAGGSGSYTWTITGLPAGISASGTTTATVTISGTPTAAGSSSITRDTHGHQIEINNIYRHHRNQFQRPVDLRYAARHRHGRHRVLRLTHRLRRNCAYTWAITGMPPASQRLACPPPQRVSAHPPLRALSPLASRLPIEEPHGQLHRQCSRSQPGPR